VTIDKSHKEMNVRCFTKNYSNIPFRVRSTGHFRITPKIQDPIIKQDFLELFWCIEGAGKFLIDGVQYILRPGEVCFYTYGDLHNLRADMDCFHYRWVVFDGSATMNIWNGLKLPKTPRFAGSCPEELFCRLSYELLDYSSNGLRQASATGFQILMLSASSAHNISASYDYVKQARHIVDANFNNPNFNINYLSNKLNINRSQLSRRFSSKYGVSPSNYLIFRRIQYGIELLCTSSLKIKDIAVKSGFSDPNYFSRCIHKYSGIPLRELRGKKVE
jgi:AraC-like DNA-binding protein